MCVREKVRGGGDTVRAVGESQREPERQEEVEIDKEPERQHPERQRQTR